MMGRTHALTGAMAFGVAAPLLDPIVTLTPAELLLGTAIATGAAVLPDIDHPGSGVSRTFGPLTQGFAWTVGKLSGGHRNGTHSFLGVAVFNLLAFAAAALHTLNPVWACIGLALSAALVGLGMATAAADTGRGRGAPAYKKPWHGLVSVWLCAAIAFGLGMAALIFGRVAGTVALGVLICLVLAAAVRPWNIKGWVDDAAPVPIAAVLVYQDVDLRVVPFAVLLGVVVHIAGDMITRGGCPLGWPWSQTMRGPQLFKTNSPIEHGPITLACWGVLIAASAWNTGAITALTQGV